MIQDAHSDYTTGINRDPIHISPTCKMAKKDCFRYLLSLMFPFALIAEDNKFAETVLCSMKTNSCFTDLHDLEI